MAGSKIALLLSLSCRGGTAFAPTSHLAAMLDCHAHISDESFDADRIDVLRIAGAAGVRGIVAVSEGVHDARAVLDLCAKHSSSSPRLHPSIGMHPCRADLSALPDMLELIDRYHAALVCVGEVGLDFSPHIVGDGDASHAARDVQRRVFSAQAQRAMQYDLAVNVHSRAAGHHAITLLAELGVRRALLHAFDGKPKYAQAAFERHGYAFSVAPSVCRSPGLQALVRRLPLEALVLETDCPALGPVKGERCVPADIAVACEWIANIKEVSVERVVEATQENARRLFPRAFL